MKLKTLWTVAAALAIGHAAALAQDKPAELKIGISTFTSGPASVFGVPGKAAAELLIDEMNKAGGIGGVKVTPIFIDEGIGGDKLLSEYRRLVQEQGVRTMLSAISSGNCNIVAPVAEDLKVLNVMWDCGTEKILENKRYKFVVRTQANATTEMVASVMYLLKVRPDFKTIAVVNQDYQWGRDSWEIFLSTLKAFKPDVRVVAEMFPKLGASDFSTEISRLQALRPDVVLNTGWGGDLDTFVRQAGQRGLFKQNITFVMPLLESSLERLGDAVPEGIIAGGRGDHYWAHPETKDDPKHKDFVAKFRAKTGAYPIYPDVPHGAGADRAEDRLRGRDQGQRRQVAQPRAGRRRHAQDEVQGVWPRDHDARRRPGTRSAVAGRDQASSEVPVRGHRQDGADPGRTRDHARRTAVADVGEVDRPGARQGAGDRPVQAARLQVTGNDHTRAGDLSPRVPLPLSQRRRTASKTSWTLPSSSLR